jgi:hypothetical protein
VKCGCSKTDALDANALNVKEQNHEAIFQLEQRLLKVFRAMFWLPSHTSTPALFTWQEFVDALHAIGFEAEELYGSTWLFSSLDGKGLLFQAPHPDKKVKIPYATARNYGMRLRLRFALRPELFELKTNNPGQA